MKIGFVTLGCSKNLLDTEVMLHELYEAGYEITPEETEADIVVINTCAFIESAKKESIDNILDIAWLKEHANLGGIVVAGCLVERYKDEVLSEFPEVDAVIGTGSVHRIVEAVDSVRKRIEEKRRNGKKGAKPGKHGGHKRPASEADGERYSSYGDINTVALGGDRVVSGSYSTYLKIGEGCDNRCTYCTIPSIRGRYRSRPIEDLTSEAAGLEKMGIREINVIAQDITRYGIDLYGGYSLPKLLRELTAAAPKTYFRLLYCYPDKITDDLVAAIRDLPHVVKYIDMPLQHISDRILRSMNRRGDSKLIKEKIATLRHEVPGITLRTTFITGFPGETDEDFDELRRFVRETGFDRIGVFPYSREEGTPAAGFDGQIDEQLKQDRADALMLDQQQIIAEKNAQTLGKTLTVLTEDYDYVSEKYYGRGAADAPDVDTKVFFGSPVKIKPGEFVEVKITDTVDYDLYGEYAGDAGMGGPEKEWR